MIESEELQDLVKSTIENVEKGLKEGWGVSGEIEFEVAVVQMAKAEGGIKLHIVGIGAGSKKEDVTKIKFKVRKKATVSFGRA